MVVTLAIVGCGQRGKNYAAYAHENPSQAKVVAVAEPNDVKRANMKSVHGLDDSVCFTDWKQIAAAGKKLADAVVIATLDKMHTEPAIAFAKLGYHILLEKPMAVDESECRAIVAAVKAAGVIFAVGHVMRYSPLSTNLKEIVDSGALGTIVSVQHLEPVGFWHDAHSYVRGNWRREDLATFMLMAKSCHDIDWLRWVIGRKCTAVSSFGSLMHFRKENKPKDAGPNCLDCPVESSCPYSAKKIYLDDHLLQGKTGWPVEVVVPNPDIESVTKALREGPYGKCVYDTDNDVVDHQVVNLEYEGGCTASFTMVAFSERICERQTKIFGTHGELTTDSETITVYDFLTKTSKHYYPYSDDKYRAPAETSLKGHGGGDWHLIRKFVNAVAKNDPSLVLSGPDETLETHLITFAAERARKNRTVEPVVMDTK